MIGSVLRAGGQADQAGADLPPAASIQLPALFGEGSLCLWLLVVGLDVERWNEHASAAPRMWSAQGEALV